METYVELVKSLQNHNDTMVEHWKMLEVCVLMYKLERALAEKAIKDYAPIDEKDFLLDVLEEITNK